MHLDIRRGFQLLLSRTWTAHFLNAPFFERALGHSGYVFLVTPTRLELVTPTLKVWCSAN